MAIRFRRGTTAQWAESTEVLLSGQPGVEYLIDGTSKLKMGDGSSLWDELPYISSEGDVTQEDLTDALATISPNSMGIWVGTEPPDIAVTYTEWTLTHVGYWAYIPTSLDANIAITMYLSPADMAAVANIPAITHYFDIGGRRSTSATFAGVTPNVETSVYTPTGYFLDAVVAAFTMIGVNPSDRQNLAGGEDYPVELLPAPMTFSGELPDMLMAFNETNTIATLSIAGVLPSITRVLLIDSVVGASIMTGINPSDQIGWSQLGVSGDAACTGVIPASTAQFNQTGVVGSVTFVGSLPDSTAMVKLAAPTSITATATTTSITLDWTAPDPAGASYSVRYTVSTDTDFSESTTVTSVVDNTEKTGLTIVAGDYIFQVKSIGNGTTTSDSAWGPTSSYPTATVSAGGGATAEFSGSSVDAGFTANISDSNSLTVSGGYAHLNVVGDYYYDDNTPPYDFYNCGLAHITSPTINRNGFTSEVKMKISDDVLGNMGVSTDWCFIVVSGTANTQLAYIDTDNINHFWTGSAWQTENFYLTNVYPDTEYRFIFSSNGTTLTIQIKSADGNTTIHSSSVALSSAKASPASSVLVNGSPGYGLTSDPSCSISIDYIRITS